MDQLALTCERIANHASRLKKIEILAEYLRVLNDDDLRLAVQFLSSGPVAEESGNHTLFAVAEQVHLSIGSSILRQALDGVISWDPEILRICYGEVGDSGETIALLLAEIGGSEPLSLQSADRIYQDLFRAGTTAHKREILRDAYRRYRPATIKYFIKVITRGLRIGLMEKMVEEAVALACDVPPLQVREANNRLGDLAEVALAARQGRLDAIGARLLHPMEFMLAKPLDHLDDLGDTRDWIIEDKFDGIRSQVHFDSGHVKIYSRGMDEVTPAFPELEAAFRTLKGSGLIDGEILGWKDDRALNFNVLQQRIARKRVRATLQTEIPVVFVGYDLLYRDGELLLNQTFEQRRFQLAQIPEMHAEPLRLSAQHDASSVEDVDRFFAEARRRGNEGLVLKRRGSIYEPGRRSGAWQKLKRVYGTLDVVITAAEQGSGRRATVLSDYTFAVQSPSGYLNVGKAYSGLTDPEVKELTRVLRSVSTDRFGPMVLVRPEVVLEVAFDGVQKSARHKSGYALRFPRILRWRKDKKPEESDDLARVEALYQASFQ